MSGLTVVPVRLREARRFIGQYHRHNLPPKGWLFGCALIDHTGQRVGVGVAGRPVARHLDDGLTVEITRTCTTQAKNANSKLYAHLCRAAFALGYRRAYTYTLTSESGASLRAAGFRIDTELDDERGWDRPGRLRAEVDLFGNERTPHEPKRRWIREAA